MVEKVTSNIHNNVYVCQPSPEVPLGLPDAPQNCLMRLFDQAKGGFSML